MARARATAALAAIGLIASGTAATAQELRFWTTEDQPARIARQEALAADFEKETGIAVQVIPVPEKDLGTRATAAFAAGDLPDVINHTLQYVLPWAEAGILDVEAATEVIEALGPETFAPAALAMSEFEDGYATVPVDGWTQMIVYRKDLFEANGLEPPRTYEAILAAVEKLHNPPEMYGFVAATKVDENYMMQVLEHVMLANGFSPVSAEGEVVIDEQKLKEALEFYKAIAKASPPGELYWDQARTVYFAGQAAMIIWSPFIMDELAGLRNDAPPTINDDPTSRELAEKTGFITTLAGPSNPDGSAWADMRYFGITTDADTDPAIEFVEYALDEGYAQTLGIAPEGKFPVRRGTAEEPEKFVELWATLPVGVDRKAPLAEIYPAEVIDDIIAGLETGDRWGVKEGQLALASKIINTRVISRIVREYIDDERSLDDTVALLKQELGKIE